MSTRPSTDDIDQGLEAWDAIVNANRAKQMDQPLPIHEHTGDESDLQGSFPAAQFGNCKTFVDHTVIGWTEAVTDGNAGWRYGFQRQKCPFRTFTSGGTLNAEDSVVFYDSGSGGSLTLPTAASMAGRFVYLKQLGTGTLTIDPNGSELIDDAATKAFSSQYDSALIYCDGNNWWILSNNP